MSVVHIKSKTLDYDVVIEEGLLDGLTSRLNPNLMYVIISDDGIPSLYRSKVIDACPHHLLRIFPQGEEFKSFEQYHLLINQLIEANIQKDACIIALGGGVTGDLAGFIAATYLRGIKLIQIPTTLLAQIDSSVGGKVAINTALSKNVIGSIYPPSLVLIDPNTLKTLPKRHLSNGMAEMIKYGMIADKEFFNHLKKGPLFLSYSDAILRSVQIKKQFVEVDEFDSGVRRMLNFGHTLGHAIESFYRYQKYLHGEAISIGMVRIVNNEIIKKELIACLSIYDLPTRDDVSLEELLPYITRDKKARSNIISTIDVIDIGSAIIKEKNFKFEEVS